MTEVDAGETDIQTRDKKWEQIKTFNYLSISGWKDHTRRWTEDNPEKKN